MNSNNYCVIMAGGVGSRFWPMSRNHTPKQFLDILGMGKTFLQMTADRFIPIIPKENIYVVTNEIYKDLTKSQLPFLSDEQILLEPARRNTAPCIAYASYKIHALNPNANILVSPSDHLITNELEFHEIIKEGLDFVEKSNSLLTLGITPTRPETGYGYIQETAIKVGNHENITKVKTFTEKPDLELAKVFIESGDFLWNSGIFLWNSRAIIEAFQKYQPDIHNEFIKGMDQYNTPKEKGFINDIYSICKSDSIDYAILEKSENVYTMRASFGWSDMGTWGSLYEHVDKDGNRNTTNLAKSLYTYDCTDSLISVPANKIAVLQGLKNYIVVDTPDALLICKKKEEQRIRNFVKELTKETGNKYI